ncbi:MAG: DHH family phosphoesterase [Phycisphaerales bacterium]|nr:DHH family phosphoesterase [Phycisphaerales bacterium]MCB9856937.1 DHH family phosphoesterase [Phycisphaerales bacterium]MCB9861936.1 DHH family phosphoesterase [Phycisphaerales bacterium]
MTEPPRIDAGEAAARLSKADRVLITTHARADGDALGSAAGLARILRARGKHVEVYLHEPVLERYRFLPEMNTMRLWSPADAHVLMGRADLLVVVDTCSAIQIGEIADAWAASSKPKLAIDHHVTRDPIVDAIYVDETNAATAAMIEHLCAAADWSIDADTATLLYSGLATDTGWFQFSNANASAFETAGRLVAAGARPNELYEQLYKNDPEARLRLIGEVLQTFEMHCDNRLAVIRIDRPMLERCKATGKLSEEVINEPQRIGSVVAAVLLIEPYVGDGPIRVSFRSKRDIDVAAIARQFGGGGHARAAGAKLATSLDEAYRQVTAVMIPAVEACAAGEAR